MARYWPYFRYQTNNLQLVNNKAPTFPIQAGERYYVSTLQNPQYIATERNSPDVQVNWTVQNMKQTDRNAFFTWWDTTTQRGEYDFTVIDYRKRALFETTWMQWREQFSKNRGGIHTLDMSLESSVGWTPPLFALYPTTTNSLADHLLDTDNDLTLNDGTLVLNSGDSDVLRLNGYALKLLEGVSARTGASNTSVSWKQGKDNSSITLMCQAAIPELSTSAELDLVKLTDGNNVLRIYATTSGESSSSSESSSESSSSSVSSSSSEASSSSSESASSSSESSSSSISESLSSTSESSSSESSTSESSSSESSSSVEGSSDYAIVFEWQKSGESAESLTIDGLYNDSEGSVAWYDLALVFDNVNNNFHAYYVRSALASRAWKRTDDFLTGNTVLADTWQGVLNDLSPTNYPEDVTWTEIDLLKGNQADLFVTGTDAAYVQNVMIIDGFLSPLEFNNIRRLFHLWNSKTTGTHPA